MVLLAEIVGVIFVAVMVLTRPDGVRSLGRVLALLGVALLPWTAVQVAGVPVGDIPLALAAPPLLLSAARERLGLPAPVWAGAGLVALSGFLTQLWPPSNNYLAGRYVLPRTFFNSIGVAPRGTGNLASLFKYEVALVWLPVVAMLACAAPDGARFARKLGVAWVAGITVNSLVALGDSLGITHVSGGLLGYVNAGGRQAGLTSQPNHIGVQTAVAVPIILFGFMGHRGRVRLAAAVALALCLYGVYLSGSRGSSVGIALAVVATIVASPTARAWSGRALAGFVVAGVFLLYTSGGATVLDALRLGTPSADVQASDLDRTLSRQQGWADFRYSPLHGVGWGHAVDAHLIYLQILAAGGIIGLLGVGVYVLGLLIPAWRLRQNDQFAAALVASAVTWLVVGLVENQLTDQYVYVPLALLAVLLRHELRHTRNPTLQLDLQTARE